MPTITTIRPNATIQLGAFTATGGTAHAVLSDDASGTYVQAPVQFSYPPGNTPRLMVGLPLPTIPAGRQITRVRLRARGAGVSSFLLAVCYIQIKLGSSYGSETLTHYSSSANTEQSGGWMTTKPGGGAWTAADLDAAQVEAWVFGGSPDYRITEIYVDVEYTDPPNVPTGISPTSGSTVTTDIPILKATITATSSRRPSYVEWQLAKDAGFSTSLQTVVLPIGQSIIEGQVTYQTPEAQQLNQGTWYIRARVVDDLGSVGSYSTAYTFTVAHAPNTTGHTPSAGQTFKYGSGTVALGWTFSDPSPIDAQTAYQVIVERNDNGAAVYDSGKVVSNSQQAAVAISGSLKDIQLRWRVRVWDSDDVAGSYSSNQIFALSDPPVGAITYPTNASTIADPNPTITWTFTAPSRYQTAYRVRILKDSNNELIYDSNIVRSAATSHTLATPILLNDTTYKIELTLTDNMNLESTPVVNTVNIHWDPPASPSFVVVG